MEQVSVDVGGILRIAIPILLVLVILLFFRYLAMRYQRVPPNKVYIRFGRGDKPDIIRPGGGVVVFPIIHEIAKLDLGLITIEVRNDTMPTKSGVQVTLNWMAQVQVDDQDEALRTAYQTILDLSKDPDALNKTVQDQLGTAMRAIVATLTVEEVHADRDKFFAQVQETVADDMQKLGMKILYMGIDNLEVAGDYFDAMSAPTLAVVKRDARIAEAEANRDSDIAEAEATRDAQVKSATALQEGEQAELDAKTKILEQKQALQLREVEVERQTELAQAESDQEVQERRALAVEQKQEAEVLVPARAERDAVEINAEAERTRITIAADASARAVIRNAEASANATERKATAEATATRQKGDAAAAARQAGLTAEAVGTREQQVAEADGTRANLLAEAEGRREIAAASAAEGEINLRQLIVEAIMDARVKQTQALAEAMAGLGANTRIVQIGNGGSGSDGQSNGNALFDLLLGAPEVLEVFQAKVQALTGQDVSELVEQIATVVKATQGVQSQPTNIEPEE